MNKTRLLAVALLAGTLALTGCRRGRGGGSDSGDTSGGDPTSQDPGQQGFDPSWISEGYTYSATFPIEQIKAFIGSGSYEVKAPSSLEGGCYYAQAEASDQSVAYFNVVVDGTQMSDYVSARQGENWTKIFQTSEGFGLVDPTLSYEVDLSEDYDEEYNPAAPTYLTFFRVGDLWDVSGNQTSDIKWDEDKLAEIGNTPWISFANFIPFTQLGQAYAIEFVDMSLYRMFGLDYPDYIAIYDSALNDSFLDGYETILGSNGFAKHTVEGVDSYSKRFVYYDMEIEYYWGSYGNEIDAYKTLVEFDAWPSDLITEWASTFIQSTKAVPAYSASTSTDVKYTFDYLEGVESEESTETKPFVQIGVSKATSDEFLAYGIAWEAAGGNVTINPGDDENYPSFKAQLGKNVMNVVFVQDYDEATETYSETDGSLSIELWCDDGADESKHINITNESSVVGISGGSLQITYESFDVDKSKIAYLSQNPDIATVSTTGLVSPVALGNATIVVYEDANGNGEYDDADETGDFIEVTVSNQITVEFTLSSAEEVSKDGVTVSFAKASGSSQPAWYSNGLRLYAKNTVTITSTGTITAISFNWEKQGSKAFATCSADVGSYTHPTEAGVGSWTGSANSVTFTLGDTGQLQLNTFSVTVS